MNDKTKRRKDLKTSYETLSREGHAPKIKQHPSIRIVSRNVSIKDKIEHIRNSTYQTPLSGKKSIMCYNTKKILLSKGNQNSDIRESRSIQVHPDHFMENQINKHNFLSKLMKKTKLQDTSELRNEDTSGNSTTSNSNSIFPVVSMMICNLKKSVNSQKRNKKKRCVNNKGNSAQNKIAPNQEQYTTIIKKRCINSYNEIPPEFDYIRNKFVSKNKQVLTRVRRVSQIRNGVRINVITKTNQLITSSKHHSTPKLQTTEHFQTKRGVVENKSLGEIGHIKTYLFNNKCLKIMQKKKSNLLLDCDTSPSYDTLNIKYSKCENNLLERKKYCNALELTKKSTKRMLIKRKTKYVKGESEKFSSSTVEDFMAQKIYYSTINKLPYSENKYLLKMKNDQNSQSNINSENKWEDDLIETISESTTLRETQKESFYCVTHIENNDDKIDFLTNTSSTKCITDHLQTLASLSSLKSECTLKTISITDNEGEDQKKLSRAKISVKPLETGSCSEFIVKKSYPINFDTCLKKCVPNVLSAIEIRTNSNDYANMFNNCRHKLNEHFFSLKNIGKSIIHLVNTLKTFYDNPNSKSYF